MEVLKRQLIKTKNSTENLTKQLLSPLKIILNLLQINLFLMIGHIDQEEE
jgi:hypothetical protein